MIWGKFRCSKTVKEKLQMSVKNSIWNNLFCWRCQFSFCCILFYSWSKQTILIEMKLVPIIKDYCLLQFDALKNFLGVRLLGSSEPNFNFFNVNPQILQRNRKVNLTNCLETNFHDISNVSLSVIRCWSCS